MKQAPARHATPPPPELTCPTPTALPLTARCCSAGPTNTELNTVSYTYTSSVDLVGHPNAGLIGVLVVGAPDSLDRCGGAWGDWNSSYHQLPGSLSGCLVATPSFPSGLAGPP